MTPPELLDLLQEFYGDTLALFSARLVNSRLVTGYDANNAYQQVLGRQEVHLRWLADAIVELGGLVPDAPETAPASTPPREHAKSVLEGDARHQMAFLDRWPPRIDSMTNARNRKMLDLIIGEMKEHLRLLEQALEGRADVLGRHSDGKVLRGEVLPVRPGN